MGYNLYLAKVVGTAAEGDDRVQVRVLPQMEGIDDNMCPRWPYFFRDEMISGTVGENVWVICDDEFSLGYILGSANYNTYVEDSFTDYAIPTDLKNTARDVLLSLQAETLSYSDIKVTYWNSNSIHFIERSTGGEIIAFKSGTLYIMRPDEFLIKIGDTKFSINSDGINLAGANLKLQSEYIGLGNNPNGSVLVTNGSASDGAYPSEYVKA